MTKKGFLTLVNEDDEVFVELSPTQLNVIVQVLGIEPGEAPGTIKCLSDKSLIDLCRRAFSKIKRG